MIYLNDVIEHCSKDEIRDNLISALEKVDGTQLEIIIAEILVALRDQPFTNACTRCELMRHINKDEYLVSQIEERKRIMEESYYKDSIS